MNKLGVHALVWVGGWSHAECTKAIEQTAKLGFDLIEIPALDPTFTGEQESRDKRWGYRTGAGGHLREVG